MYCRDKSRPRSASLDIKVGAVSRTRPSTVAPELSSRCMRAARAGNSLPAEVTSAVFLSIFKDVFLFLYLYYESVDAIEQIYRLHMIAH